MKPYQPMSPGNIRPFLLFLVVMTALSLAPMLSHGAVFWDDEMENGNTDLSPAYMLSTLIPQGTMAYDTNVKFSGNGSIRLNFPARCQTLTTANQCGGSITRTYPLSFSIWNRVYFRMSGTGPNPTSSGLFEVAHSLTKLLKGQSNIVGGLFTRDWLTMGPEGSKRLLDSMENVPFTNGATNLFTNITLADNRWYCIETHKQMNTPGLSDGISEVFVDGAKVAGSATVNWRRPGSIVLWSESQLFRQIGAGNLWFDRFAAGDTRIGCLGATPRSDTTPPGPTQGLVIR